MDRRDPPGTSCVSCLLATGGKPPHIPDKMITNGSPIKPTIVSNGKTHLPNGNHYRHQVHDSHNMNGKEPVSEINGRKPGLEINVKVLETDVNSKKPSKDANGHLDLVTDHYCCIKKTTSSAIKSAALAFVNNDSSQQENAEEKDYEQTCGLLSLRPQWLQKFANKKAFLAVFCLTSVLQGMYYTYFVSVLTTIEKLYHIPSRTTGIIMAATEVGQVGGSLFLAYVGGRGHRPKWIAGGMLVFGLASFLCATPHFLYGKRTNPTKFIADLHENTTMASLRELRTKLCHINFHSLHPASEVNSSASAWTTTYPSSTSSPSSSHLSSSSSSISDYSIRLFNSSIPEASPSVPNKSSGYQEEVLLVSFENETHFRQQQLFPRTDAYLDHSGKCESKTKSGLQAKETETVLAIFFISLLLIGIGATAVYTLGIPYIDDNVANRDSPLYFALLERLEGHEKNHITHMFDYDFTAPAITIGVRIFGPVFGFLLGSYCTSVYVDFLSEDTTMTPDDPQWIGAWWLGVFIVGTALIITAAPMMSFPKRLPQHKPKSKNKPRKTDAKGRNSESSVKYKYHEPKEQKKPFYIVTGAGPKKGTIKMELLDFLRTVVRLMKNKILMYRTASSVLHILPIAGLYTFLPKYLESQFQLTATYANMISGVAGILVMGLGIFISGALMKRWKPDAKKVARWIAGSALLYSAGMLILIGFGCPLNEFAGLNAGSDMENPNHKICNETCGCRTGEFAPICTSEGVTYLSPCLAGCTEVSSTLDDQFVYSNCHCLGAEVTAKNGFCPLQCDNLIWYIFVFAVFVFIHSTTEVGSMLLTLRCVDPEDKAMALGVISLAIGLFGNVPCPIIYGSVVDSACVFWEDNCGETGACRLYDPSKFRFIFHGVTSVIVFVAFLVDLLVCFKASSIQFDDDVKYEDEEAEPMNALPSNAPSESSV